MEIKKLGWVYVALKDASALAENSEQIYRAILTHTNTRTKHHTTHTHTPALT